MKAAPFVLLALLLACIGAPEARAQHGGFGGVGGGGPRPTGSNALFNRAGTSSSGGFAYGDAPRAREAPPTADAPLPCKVEPVVVKLKQYYKCPEGWYVPALTDAGLIYRTTAAPPGYQ
jgi:hypothetical protein